MSMKRIVKDFLEGFLLWMVGYIPSMHIRMFIYRHVYRMSIASNVIVYKGAEFRGLKGLRIGEGTIVGDDAMLDARAGLVIGKNVNLSSGVEIWTLQHDYRDPDFKCNPEHFGQVNIGDRAWIGPRVTILPKVSIGEGAVVAAGAVVTKNVESFDVVGGIPAKKIGVRPQNLRYEFDGKHRHFI